MGFRGAIAIALALGVLTLPFPAESAGRGLTLGLGDPAFGDSDGAHRLDLAVAADAQMVRLGANWALIAPQRPADPANPADPAYRFGGIDAVIKAASARGLRVLLEVGRAPAWAEGAGRPLVGGPRPGTWRPDPGAYGQFARAVALRYSGAFVPGPGQPPLPKVGDFQAWNEPNLSAYLTPQWSGGEPASPQIYRSLLAAFYDGVKSVDAGNTVVSAGTAPYGDEPGEDRMRPLTFIREMLCLRGGPGCEQPVPLDVLAHHPINADAPFTSAENPQDATTGDLGKVRKLLRRAERKRLLRPGGSRPIWVTEFWWESNPPDDSRYGVPIRLHARYHAEALYLFWKQKIPLALALQVADAPIAGGDPVPTLQSGLYFADGRAKKTLRAFRFPFVSNAGKRRVRAWGRAPVAGKLVIEVRNEGSWRTVKRKRVRAGKVFNKRVDTGRRRTLRARVGDVKSLAYRPRLKKNG